MKRVALVAAMLLVSVGLFAQNSAKDIYVKYS